MQRHFGHTNIYQLDSYQILCNYRHVYVFLQNKYHNILYQHLQCISTKVSTLIWVNNMQILHTFVFCRILDWTSTLREKCLYSEFFWSVFFRIQTEYGEILRISPYSDQMHENTHQKNSEYGHILRSAKHV